MADQYYNITTKVYKTIFKTLYAHTKENGHLTYLRTIQSRFYPLRGGELEHQALYPFVFLSFVEQGAESIHAMPNIVQFQTQLGIVVMQYNDGDVDLQGETYSSTNSAGVTISGTITGKEFGHNVSTPAGEGFIDNSGTKKGIIEIIEVEEGQVLTFPASVIHRSPVNETDGKKMIISFNSSFDSPVM